MRILIAEDDPVSRTVLERTLLCWGHQVVVTCDGLAALAAMSKDDAPRLALLDWMMPEIDGVEVCRHLRSLDDAVPAYLILLTAKDQKEDVAIALEDGANDYLVKPFNRRELRARIRVGERIVALQTKLAENARHLNRALAQVAQLEKLLPRCSHCKKVRNDDDYWQSVETYFELLTEVQRSHARCPDCYDQVAATTALAATES
jgi:DNA-binding response OmpR family regulator